MSKLDDWLLSVLLKIVLVVTIVVVVALPSLMIFMVLGRIFHWPLN